MQEYYVLVKWLHVAGAAVILGAGLAIAFHLWIALRGASVAVIAAAARTTVIADFVFTLPAVLLQPITGITLAWIAGYPLASTWIVASVGLYLVAGACWIPVVFIQLRMAGLAEIAARSGNPLGEEFRRLQRRWLALGWPAFLAVAATYWLMIARPA